MPAEFFDDFCDFAGEDTLDIHLGQSKQEGLFTVDTLFQSAGVRLHAVANLRDAQMDWPDTGGKGFGLEAIGATEPILTTLVRAGLKDGGALLNHGLVDEQA